VSEFANAEEIEYHPFFPLLPARFEGHRTALPGRIHQNIDVSEHTPSFISHTLWRILVEEIRRERNDPAASFAADFAGQLLDQRNPPCHSHHRDTRQSEHARRSTADTLARASDKRSTPCKIQVHLLFPGRSGV
jgi:hypothetical protein